MSTMTGAVFRCHRTPVMEGVVTQSLDGKPLCNRLMGDIKEWDSGTLRTTVFPNFWQHTNCDYAAAARLTPIGPDETHVRGYWLVDAEAVEGRDYTLDRLLPIWDITNRQDWTICEDQQEGVSSQRLRARPLLAGPRTQRRALPRLVPRQSCARDPAEPGPHRRDRRRCGGLLHRLSPRQARPEGRAGAGEERPDARLDLACRRPGRASCAASAT